MAWWFDTSTSTTLLASLTLMAVHPEADPTSPKQVASCTLRKVNRRLIPFLFLLYIVAWLDRVNVGFAALQMNSDLGFSSSAFGFGSGVFFIGYCLFEVPSNLILHRVGARIWIARIMITWGILSAATMFGTPLMFYLIRFLLGAAEAGFFPGLIYYLGFWYPMRRRARAIATFMTAVPVTGLIGGPVSGLLLGLHGRLGLTGWQWLFLAEGIPAVFLGATVLVYLSNKPSEARWLTSKEKTWLTSELAADEIVRGQQLSLLNALTSATTWRLGIIFLLTAIGFFGYSFWSPLIIKSLTGRSDLAVGMITAAMSAATIGAMLFNSWHSDGTGERARHVAVPIAITAVGFVGCAFFRDPMLALFCLALVPIGHCGSYGPFWSLPTSFLSGSAAAGGVALVTSLAAAGGFIGPALMGFLKDKTGTHVIAFELLAALAFTAAVLAWRLRIDEANDG
jgi:MFS transporter, ACS family, tartrate transporter